MSQSAARASQRILSRLTVPNQRRSAHVCGAHKQPDEENDLPSYYIRRRPTPMSPGADWKGGFDFPTVVVAWKTGYAINSEQHTSGVRGPWTLLPIYKLSSFPLGLHS